MKSNFGGEWGNPSRSKGEGQHEKTVPEGWLPTCTAGFPLSCSDYLRFVHHPASGWVRLTPFAKCQTHAEQPFQEQDNPAVITP